MQGLEVGNGGLIGESYF
jgi:hypothetical protein